ncbi:DUF1027 domain-containing protein [Brevibacillus laterosporus]|uniref:DUF1027 domain-containing protein n=1 Tax=Brevibacillus laterosporus TaxID=1465 RepID=A0A502IXA1_BRELA|nr:YutD family protein [Brevibacillus laterosporus]QDX91293.1 DUF1027 domain-containing protein [Brevibacillus laterosporus]RAP23520.1 hypothetical protein C2W64_03029 [Brevibacillus laterosporus]TPG69694.1 DUF1027 domain-containing protein [Brevibacillus laterosporus]TPG90464.1 DUF1027 domain-containing protein [Brevibacillus laterosporus]
MIRLQAGVYELMEENRDGWNLEVCKERYSDVLDKYDYIVGDWGYGQLRLRGFFENTNRKVPFEHKIAALDEYLQEYCNFGCAYFVLKRTKRLNGSELGDETDQALIDAESLDKESSSQATQAPTRPRNYERPFKRRSDKNDKPSRFPRPDRDRPNKEAKDGKDRGNQKAIRAEQGSKEKRVNNQTPRGPRVKPTATSTKKTIQNEK